MLRSVGLHLLERVCVFILCAVKGAAVEAYSYPFVFLFIYFVLPRLALTSCFVLMLILFLYLFLKVTSQKSYSLVIYYANQPR